MARTKASINFNAALEVGASAPLDSRAVVNTKSDLTDADSFPYSYDGMQVYVKAEKKTYVLTEADTTLETSWKELGSGGSVDMSAVDAKIAEALEDFDHLDYKIADTTPTATQVVIKGEVSETKEGVRYLVRHETDNAYEEYILVDGVIYDIGNTGSVDLSDYATTEQLALKADSSALGDKVDKVSGKGLSTNDYDAAAKTKLDSLVEFKAVGAGLSLSDGTLSVDEATDAEVAAMLQEVFGGE